MSGTDEPGVHLAQRLGELLNGIWGHPVPVGHLDVGMHRDDLDQQVAPRIHPTIIPFDVTGKTVVLVDDVLFSGRTTRAAICRRSGPRPRSQDVRGVDDDRSAVLPLDSRELPDVVDEDIGIDERGSSRRIRVGHDAVVTVSDLLQGDGLAGVLARTAVGDLGSADDEGAIVTDCAHGAGLEWSTLETILLCDFLLAGRRLSDSESTSDEGGRSDERSDAPPPPGTLH